VTVSKQQRVSFKASTQEHHLAVTTPEPTGSHTAFLDTIRDAGGEGGAEEGGHDLRGGVGKGSGEEVSRDRVGCEGLFGVLGLVCVSS
jgi:hypothetical protein